MTCCDFEQMFLGAARERDEYREQLAAAQSQLRQFIVSLRDVAARFEAQLPEVDLLWLSVGGDA